MRLLPWGALISVCCVLLLLLLLPYENKILPTILPRNSVFSSHWLQSQTSLQPEVRPDPYDPHDHVPSLTPWFEGWYTRATLSDASVAFAIGSFRDLPSGQPPSPSSDPSVVCFVIVDTGTGRPCYAHLPQAAVQVSRATDQARPSFQVLATQQSASSSSLGEQSGGHCNLTVDAGHMSIQVYLPGVLNLDIRSDAVPSAWMPWSSGAHPSPEAYVGPLLDLHYHVYSLATPAQLQLQWLSEQQRGAPAAAAAPAAASPPRRRPRAPRDLSGPALAHMEKNWGSGFPPRWIWAQGHLKQPQRGFLQETVAFVLAGGSISSPLPSVLPDMYQYVLSIRSTCQQTPGGERPSPSRSRTACTPLDVQIDPWDPSLIFEEQVASCQGTVGLKLFSSSHIVEAKLSALPSTFTGVPCPSRSGSFQDAGAVESFQAAASFKVWTRPFPFAPEALCTLAAELSFNDAALEFGGAHMCVEQAQMQER